jgi:hypothetical protein
MRERFPRFNRKRMVFLLTGGIGNAAGGNMLPPVHQDAEPAPAEVAKQMTLLTISFPFRKFKDQIYCYDRESH